MDGTFCPIAYIDVVVFNAVVRFEGHAGAVCFSQAAAISHHAIERVAIAVDVFHASCHGPCATFRQNLKLAAAGTIAVPEIWLGADGQIFVDFEFGFACEQVIAEWIDVVFVETISRCSFRLSSASDGCQVLGHDATEIKIASVLRNLCVAQRANIVVDSIVVQNCCAQKYIGRRSDFSGNIDVLTVCAARTFEFVSSCFGIRNKGFGAARAKFTCV